ncbi:MAG: GrpB family protein [Candidatus Nealsonbacteria bacterium DGGOD1a]|jgi:Uncharacterized conserved protein|nr:MAG: GrpB family protein [Candidatus Nealsonbacteria bacterium DGGOD1a]
MITSEQEKWLAHLPDGNSIEIHPYDPTSLDKFSLIKQMIKKTLGKGAKIELHGAVSFGISGQGEIDIDIPVSPADFDTTIKKMERAFGKPGSLYPLRRARFVICIKETKAEIIVVNEECADWTNLLEFEEHLKTHPKALNAYEKIKEAAAGLSTQKYYRAKTKFINRILAKCK